MTWAPVVTGRRTLAATLLVVAEEAEDTGEDQESASDG